MRDGLVVVREQCQHVLVAVHFDHRVHVDRAHGELQVWRYELHRRGLIALKKSVVVEHEQQSFTRGVVVELILHPPLHQHYKQRTLVEVNDINIARSRSMILI